METSSFSFFFFYFHKASVISCFQHDTKYYYKIGSGDSSREFWFITPPKINPDASYKFGIIGELFSLWNRSY